MNKYSEYRSNIKSGDLLVWSHTSWKTLHDIKIQLVRFFTQSEYAHCGVAWVVGSRVFVLEAREPCVRIFPLSKLGNFYHLPLKAPWSTSTEEKALSYIGAEYKQLHAIKAFFKPLDKGDVSECAALALAILENDGIYLGDRSTPDALVKQAQLYGNPTYYIENT